LNPGDQIVVTFTARPNIGNVLALYDEIDYANAAVTITGSPVLTTRLYSGQTLLGTYVAQPYTYNYSGVNYVFFVVVFVPPGGGQGLEILSPAEIDFSSINNGITNGRMVTTISGGVVSGLDLANFTMADFVSSNGDFVQQTDINVTSITLQSVSNSCQVAVTPSTASFGANGGTGSLSVTPAGLNCTWNVSSNVPGLTITAGSIGTGSGTVNYTVQPNPASVSRGGTITVTTADSQASVTVTQGGTACSYSLPQASQAFTGAGGSGSVTISAPGGCGWGVDTGGASWITINSAISGSGDGVVSYSVAANVTNSSRVAALTIAGQSYVVKQSAAGVAVSCTASGTASQTALEGRTELLGELLLDCAGLPAAVAATVSLSLNTNITNGITGGDTVDALLAGPSGSQNGHIAGYNTVRWTGVAMGPGETVLHLTGVRADASLLGNGSNLPAVPITAQVSVVAGDAVPVTYAAPTGCGFVSNAATLACASTTLLFQKGQPSPPTGGAQTTIPLAYQEAAASEFHTGAAATRLRLSLRGIPPTVQVYAPVYPIEGATHAQLYSADASGTGGSPVSGAPLAGGTYQQLTVSGGAATATWVVLSLSPTLVDKWTFPLLVTNASNSDLNAIQIAASLGPVSDAGVASSTAPIPRYRDFSVAQKLVNLRVTTVTSKTAGSSSAAAHMAPRAVGSNLTSTVTLLNDTSDPSQAATNVKVQGNVSGASIVNCTATGSGSCAGSGAGAVANFGTLAAGEQQTVTLTEQVDPSLTSGTVDNAVGARSDQTNTDLTAASAASSYLVNNIGPVVLPDQPSSGSGSSRSFTFQFSHPNGWQSLGILNVLISNVLDARRACYLAYSVPASTLYLVNDAGDAGGPFAGTLTLGSNQSIQNSQCAVTLTSASGSGLTFSLTLNITFTAAFGGNKVAYVAARDQAQNNSNWQAVGVWQAPWTPPGTITLANLSQPRGTGASGTEQFTVMDSKGTGDIGIVNILMNSAIDARQACYLAYVAATNTLILVNDAGQAGGPFAGSMPLSGGSATIQNGQCQVKAFGSSAQANGNSLTLTLNLTFFAGFGGNRIIYVAGRDQAYGNNTDWQAMGTWSIQ
jgi:hypothetical protein